MANKSKNKVFISILAILFCFTALMAFAQSMLTNADVTRLGLKKPQNIKEAQTLMQASYKECMQAINDFNNDKISGRESDEKLQIYMYYKSRYDKMLSEQNQASNTQSQTQTQNNSNNSNNNGGSSGSNSNQANQTTESPLPHSELVTDRTLRETGSLAPKKGFFAGIIDFFSGLFGGGKKNELLDVPLRTQLDPANGANGTHYCAPACLAMVLEYHGIKLSTKEVAKLCNTDVKGTTYSDDMLNAAKKLGLNGSFAGGGANIDWLKNTTASGIPVIVYVDTKSYGMADGHCMVVTGVKDGYVYVNDPWTGKQLRYGTAAFNAIWTTRSYYGVVVKK
jgi:uncharacterized protein YvpB